MNTLKSKNSDKKVLAFYGIIFVVLFFLCLLFPYTGDDWAWGSQLGLDRLDNWFDNYSGRYFGNLIVLALTRSNILKAVVMAFCLTGIIVLVNKLTGEQKNGVFIISTALVCLPIGILRQAIVWTAGFSNYTTSIFLTLIYIYYVNNIYGDEKPKNSFGAVIPLVVLGFANTLIVEHLTLYNVVLAIYVIVFTIVKFKKAYIQHIAYFLGTIAGTVLMFSNSVYRSVADGSDDYRTIGSNDGIIAKALKAYFETIVPEGFINNFVLNILLVGICVIIWINLRKKLKKRARTLGGLCIAVMVAFAASSLMIRISSLTELKSLIIAEGIATAAYILAFIVFVFVIPVDGTRRMKLLFILGSTGCMIAPLFVVTPIGSRCFFAPYVMMIYLAIEFYSMFSPKLMEKCNKFSKVFIITSAVGVLFLFYVYSTIAVCNNERVEKAQTEAANGAEVVEVEELPYSKYVWCSELEKEIWQNRFKMFYDIDESVEIKQISSKQKW